MDAPREWLDKLKATVDEYRERVADAERAVTAAETRLDGVRKDLQVAEHFLIMETAKVSNQSPREVPLGKAAAAIVEEKGTVTIREIIETLEARGFRLETKFPGRAIHAALLHAPGVRKIAPGTYEAEQVRLI
jgi:hypothetical protein